MALSVRKLQARVETLEQQVAGLLADKEAATSAANKPATRPRKSRRQTPTQPDK